MTTEKRKEWIKELNATGITVTNKMDTKRLRVKYLKMKKEQRKVFDKTPNPFMMTSTERNRAKRQRKRRLKK